MKRELRNYQDRAREKVRRLWSQGARRVVVVSPTGSGKTTIGTSVIEDARNIVWVAHRRELVNQARQAVAREVGSSNVGVIMAGIDPTPSARVQVCSIETIFTRGAPDKCDLLVFDECHHVAAKSYRSVVDIYPRAKLLGLTATPERYDGKPLDDVFQHMVVAAQYSELIEQGHLVPVDVVRPTEYLGNDIVIDPIEAWERFVRPLPGHRGTFAFFGRVEDADQAASRWRARGVRAELIEANTGKTWRDDAIELFGASRLDVLTNVYALTEGVDVPDARAALSCRSFKFSGAMLQAFGRVLRAAPGKERAVILDLTGATHIHGLPTEDREYSLEGRAIKQKPSRAHTNANPYVYSQEIVGGDLEVATLGEDPGVAFVSLPVVTARRGAFRSDKLRSVRQKHGKRAMRSAAEYYDKLGD